MKDLSFKEFMNRLLTGMSIGIVVALIPGALLGELAKALHWDMVVLLTKQAQVLLAPAMGLCIALQFKLTPIQSATLAITTMVGSGAIKVVDGALTLAGIGDVINAGLVAGVAVFIMLIIGNHLKAYTILVLPTVIVVCVGWFGLWSLTYVSQLTGLIGKLVNGFTTLQPVLAGILIAVTFAVMIISPISTAGVALAISLTGVGSGAANLGICAAGFGLAIAGWKVNGLGTSIAHFLGSPKMQMANFIKKPIMVVPIVVNAAVMGMLAGLFSIQGTPASAGFGISGLIGPINHLNIVQYTPVNILIAVLIFVVAPVVLSFICTYLFERVLKWVKPEDYQIKFN